MILAVPSDPAWSIVGAAFGLGCVLEYILYFAAPWLFARLAIVPVGEPRRVHLTRTAWEALSTEAASTGYREAVARRFDLSRLRITEHITTLSVVGRVFPSRGFAIARLPYKLSDKIMALARIDIVSVGDNAVELRARFIPLFWATSSSLCRSPGLPSW